MILSACGQCRSLNRRNSSATPRVGGGQQNAGMGRAGSGRVHPAHAERIQRGVVGGVFGKARHGFGRQLSAAGGGIHTVQIES